MSFDVVRMKLLNKRGRRIGLVVQVKKLGSNMNNVDSLSVNVLQILLKKSHAFSKIKYKKYQFTVTFGAHIRFWMGK